MKTKLRSLIFKNLIILAGITIISSCYELPDTESIVMPSWEIESINIPLVSQTKTLLEILEDDTTLTWFPVDGEQSPGLLLYSQSERITGSTIGDRLTLDPSEVLISNSIGPVKIGNIAPFETNISISDWTPFHPDESVVVPPLTVVGQQSEFALIDAFQSVKLNKGKINLILQNKLPVAITYNNFHILNNGGSGLQITKPLPSFAIEPNGIREFDIEIEPDVTIINNLLVNVDMSSSGSDGQIVTFPDEAGTTIIAELVNTEISNVIAEIPQNIINIESTFSFDSGNEPIELALAEIFSGSFVLNVQSQVDIDAELDITFHDMYDNYGNPFTVSTTIPRKGNLQINEPDLAGWKIEPLELTNKLRYSVTARTISTTDGDYREISENDGFNVSLEVSELVFSKVDGRFNAEFQMEEQTFRIDYGDFFDRFNFEALKLEDSFIYLDLLTSTYLPVIINDAVLTASNGIVENSINLDQITLPSSQPIKIAISDLFNGMTQVLPDDFRFNGVAAVNPANERIQVEKADSIFGIADIEIPLKIMIAGGSYSDNFELDIPDGAKDEIKKIQRLSINFNIINNIPASASLAVSVFDSLGNNVLNIPTGRDGTDKIYVTPPVIDADGEITGAGETTISLELTGEDVSAFLLGKNAQLDFQFETAGNSNEPVRLKITDSITYTVWGEVNYKFDN